MSDDEQKRLDDIEAAKMREYFKGETVVEYRPVLLSVDFKRTAAHRIPDSTGGGVIVWQYDGKDAEGQHWRHFSIEYVWNDGTRYEMAEASGYIRIEHEQDQ